MCNRGLALLTKTCNVTQLLSNTTARHTRHLWRQIKTRTTHFLPIALGWMCENYLRLTARCSFAAFASKQRAADWSGSSWGRPPCVMCTIAGPNHRHQPAACHLRRHANRELQLCMRNTMHVCVRSPSAAAFAYGNDVIVTWVALSGSEFQSVRSGFLSLAHLKISSAVAVHSSQRTAVIRWKIENVTHLWVGAE